MLKRMTMWVLPLVALALLSCSDREPKGSSQPVDADNTARNERDRDASLPTPMDQGENQQDLGITQSIRQGVMSEGSLSMDAKNAKIITNGGIVVLRGPVANDAEKTVIQQLAENTPGVVRVANLLEVKAPGY